MKHLFKYFFFFSDKTFSDEFRDFVTKCVTKDPRQRPTADEMLEHPFLKKAHGVVPLVEEVQLHILENPEEEESEDETEQVRAFIRKPVLIPYFDLLVCCVTLPVRAPTGEPSSKTGTTMEHPKSTSLLLKAIR